MIIYPQTMRSKQNINCCILYNIGNYTAEHGFLYMKCLSDIKERPDEDEERKKGRREEKSVS